MSSAAVKMTDDEVVLLDRRQSLDAGGPAHVAAGQQVKKQEDVAKSQRAAASRRCSLQR